MSKLATRRNQTKKEAREHFKKVIAERGIVSVNVVTKPIIPKRKFFFTAHAKERLWERFGVRVSELDLCDLKVIIKSVLMAHEIKVPRGYFCLGKDNFALICSQRAPNKFDVVTVYKLEQ